MAIFSESSSVCITGYIVSRTENGKSLCSLLLCGVTLTYSSIMNWKKMDKKVTVIGNFLERFMFRCLTDSAAKK